MLIIGFGHKARQGKNVAADAIVDYYKRKRATYGDLGYKIPEAQSIGFATALYEVCRNEYGMMVKDAPLLQRIGMERRSLDPNYWIKRAFAAIKPMTDIVLIPDLRFVNEAEYIKAQGGYLIDIKRLNADGTQHIAQDRPADHPSETALDGYNFDFYLTNSHGHQALLAEQAITLVDYLRGLESK
jgi:hypothetical protein